MWKKSGAWFYKEMPNYTKPFDMGSMGNGLFGSRMGVVSPSTASTPSGNRSKNIHVFEDIKKFGQLI